MTFEDFVHTEETIYKNIGSKTIDRTAVDSNLTDRVGGYIVALRYDDESSQKLSSYAKAIGAQIPGVVFDAQNLHSTLAQFGSGPQFQYNESQMAQFIDKTRAHLNPSKAISNSVKAINVGEVASMAFGIANEGLYDILMQLQKTQFKVSNLTHVTLNRFTQEGYKPVTVECEPFIATPRSIDIGYFKCQENEFELNVYDEVEL